MKLQETSFFSHVQSLKDRKKIGSALFGNLIRSIKDSEISSLKSQGVICDDWSQILVPNNFSGFKIRACRLEGSVILGSADICFSTIVDSEIGDNCAISHCSQIKKTIIEPKAVITGAFLDCSASTTYGNGQKLTLGLETGGRLGIIWAGMTFPEALDAVKDPSLYNESNLDVQKISWEYSIVGEGSKIQSCSYGNQFYLSANAYLLNVQEIVNSTVLGTKNEETMVSGGALVRNSLLMEGVHVDSGALVCESAMLEHSTAERSCLITQSLVGPDTHCAEGEITASLVGPFVGFHHQSLLIAAWWPEGRGNIGYGANVGSNHTSRVPDQEIYPGEGTFFGLDCAIKFPSNLREAPYSLISTSVVLPPQILSLPFSLILNEFNPNAPGLNRLIPAWVLKENVYSLMRQEGKFIKRQKGLRHSWDFRVFRPENVDRMVTAWECLRHLSGKSIYTELDSSLIGKNYVTESDRLTAMDAYHNFIRYALIKLSIEPKLNKPGADLTWIQTTAVKVNIELPADRDLEITFLTLEEALWEAALKSREKDTLRGKKIIPDYLETHSPAEEDSFLVEKKAEISLYKKLFKG